jgi:hypothetical protein
MDVYKCAEKIHRQRVKRAYRLIPTVIILSGIILGLFHFNYILTVEYPYQKSIGTILDNAYDASTFELMKNYYIQAKNAMINQELTPNLYGKWFYWEKTPDWQMDYTYLYIDGLVSRCDYYINLTKTTNISPLTDVYDQMITNMRTESLRNGPVDWTAGPAWVIKYAPMYYWGWIVWAIIIACDVATIATLVLLALESEYDIREAQQKKKKEENES